MKHMGQFRRLIIFLHRYLGIPMSVVFVVWFVSGVVMMYAGGMPTLTAEERLNRLPALDLSAVRVSPATAAETAGVRGFVWDAELTTVLERPAYRFGQGGITVFADTGDILDTTSREQARRAASQFLGLPQASLEFAGTVSEPDQWTLTHRADLPLDRFVADDGAASWVYVSQYSGEVVLVTDRQTRLLAWLGTIPHWFYFTPLRLNQPLWYWTVVWTAALGCVLAVLGLILGVIQFRRSKPFDLNKSIRYRGWMRWHYYTGILFGLFALTWVFSGLMSMEPFAWTTARGLEIPSDALQGGSLTLDAYPTTDDERWRQVLWVAGLKEIEYLRIHGNPYLLGRYTPERPLGERERLNRPYSVSPGAERDFVLVDARTFQVREAPVAVEEIVGLLRNAAPGVDIADHELLDDYDAYYYSRDGQATLPVLRVKFADPLQTWYYVDPALSRIVSRVHRWSRLERWLFNGLHSLDFRFWYDRRPLWDIGMIVLSIGALATSLIGLYLGARRLGARSARPVSDYS